MASTGSSASSTSSTVIGNGTSEAHSSSTAPAFLNPYATVTARSHIPITLDLKNPNYTKWSSFFKSMCGKFGSSGTLTAATLSPTATPGYRQTTAYAAGCSAPSPRKSSTSPMVDDQTAQQLWTAIKDLFDTNKESHAVFLSHEFHSLRETSPSPTTARKEDEDPR
ncbi:hypothetical protein U9M48_018874 [Paspalum notatum var. saurae]|uniref:Uncharacterized protein n=1 Tax=Paspalum notatum var. saurae TaxID=547442 RepID=A0AAQ3TB04_PASNO